MRCPRLSLCWFFPQPCLSSSDDPTEHVPLLRAPCISFIFRVCAFLTAGSCGAYCQLSPKHPWPVSITFKSHLEAPKMHCFWVLGWSLLWSLSQCFSNLPLHSLWDFLTTGRESLIAAEVKRLGQSGSETGQGQGHEEHLLRRWSCHHSCPCCCLRLFLRLPRRWHLEVHFSFLCQELLRAAPCCAGKSHGSGICPRICCQDLCWGSAGGLSVARSGFLAVPSWVGRKKSVLGSHTGLNLRCRGLVGQLTAKLQSWGSLLPPEPPGEALLGFWTE